MHRPVQDFSSGGGDWLSGGMEEDSMVMYCLEGQVIKILRIY